MYLPGSQSRFPVGNADLDLTVKPAWAAKRRVNSVGPVSRAYTTTLPRALRPSITASSCATTRLSTLLRPLLFWGDAVYLIYQYDAWRIILLLPEICPLAFPRTHHRNLLIIRVR